MSEYLLHCLQTEFEWILSGLCVKQYRFSLKRVLHCHALGRFTEVKWNQDNKVKYDYFPLNREVHSHSDGPYCWLGLKSITLISIFLIIYLKCQSGALQWITSIWKERFRYAHWGAISPSLYIGQTRTGVKHRTPNLPAWVPSPRKTSGNKDTSMRTSVCQNWVSPFTLNY